MAGIKKELRVNLEQWVDKAVWWHSSGCLLWVGPVDEEGYPRIYYQGGERSGYADDLRGVDDKRGSSHMRRSVLHQSGSFVCWDGEGEHGGHDASWTGRG